VGARSSSASRSARSRTWGRAGGRRWRGPIAASIAIRLRAPAEDRPAWRYVLLSGATLTAAALLVAAAVVFALADGGDNEISGETLQALNVLGSDTWLRSTRASA
jgi:hypothetical protein